MDTSSHNPVLLQDQVVLITGAGRAPAPKIAEALAAQGAIIAANDLSPILLDPLVEGIRAKGGRAISYIADPSRGMPLRAMLDEVLENAGKIDILVNNPRIRPEAALIDMDEYDWQRTIDTNLNGSFLVTQLVARLMREQGKGVILNIVDTDPAALQHPGYGAYAASQAALMAFSQAASRELIAYNIRVHTLCPEAGAAGALDQVEETLGRAAVYLCSARAAHLSGQIIAAGKPGLEILPEE